MAEAHRNNPMHRDYQQMLSRVGMHDFSLASWGGVPEGQGKGRSMATVLVMLHAAEAVAQACLTSAGMQ